MSKKDKKDKKLFGMIDLNDPMMIGVVVVLILLCVYLGVVIILTKPWNIFEWFSGSSTTSEVANTSAPSSGQSASSYVPPPPPPPDAPLTIDQIGMNAANVPVQGGKLLRKLRRR